MKLYLKTHCKALRELRLDGLGRREIASHLGIIAKKSGGISANRARATLSGMFAWAMKEGLCEANPVIGTNVPAVEVPRERVLSEQEIAAIWNALPDNEYGAIVKLLFLTGCRPDEIGALKWSEIEPIEARRIAFPAERVKNGHAFDLPLSDSAFWLLLRNPQRIGRDLVFGKGAGGFQGWSKAKAQLDAGLGRIPAWQLRDIRRTVSTNMAENGVEPHIVEACLNHVSGHKAGVAGVYNRATCLSEKRRALDLWGAHLFALLTGCPSNVVTLTSHGRQV